MLKIESHCLEHCLRCCSGAECWQHCPLVLPLLLPAGSIQVTLKSPSSVPPYRIENSCKDVQLYFIQLALVNRAASKR